MLTQNNSKKGVAALLVRNRVAQIYEDEIISDYVTYKVFAIAVIKTGFKPVVEVAKKLEGEGYNNFFSIWQERSETFIVRERFCGNEVSY